MELHQLRYFVAVAELEHFTRAAARCRVSQPSLSQQIMKLERDLGQPLLERLGRSVRLTDAGRSLYGRATAILRLVDEAQAHAKAEGDWQADRVSVAAILTVAPYLLPPLINAFQRSYPRGRLTVREDFTAKVVAAVASGDVDLAFVALPVDDDRLTVEPLFDEPLLLAMPAGHRLESRKRVDIRDLDDEPFVLIDETHCLGEQIVGFCRQHTCAPMIACTSAQMLTVQEMVGLGQGVSLVPEMAARADRSRKRTYRQLDGNAPRRTLAMIRRRDRQPNRLLEAFWQLADKSLRPATSASTVKHKART
ncbi:LysR family transcriptional regulator [Phycisphaerales bacterium AB-hyl4]|uniref:LysR family transcriptional regulator n=1 Tax=Natronomicrosphaera hydrolytica TaxID=3242702 RepID=A0ABV4UAN2_9BACT